MLQTGECQVKLFNSMVVQYLQPLAENSTISVFDSKLKLSDAAPS